MRYLIYSCCFETPHLETEMEVARKVIEDGHEVFFLICEADLKTCFINPEHKGSVCAVCQSKVKTGLKFLDIPKERILKLSQFKNDEFNLIPAFSSINELKEFTYQQSDIGLAVASSIISYTRDHQFDINDHRDQVKDGIKTAIMVHDKGIQILDAVKPDVVIMFNGRFLEYRPIMRLCEKRGIDFYTHERGGQLDRYMLRKNSIPHSIAFAKAEIEDMWLNAGPEKEKIGTDFFLGRRNRVIQSWSVFTEEQKVGLLPEGFDKAKKNIGFFNSSMDEYEGISGFNNPIYHDDNDGIEKVCQSFINDSNYHFYLRVHPNLKGLDNAQNKAIAELKDRFSNLTVIAADNDIDTYALMEAVDIVVTFGSTMGVEAMFWNKPSLLLGRAFYERLEGIVQPATHEEVIHSIVNTPAVGFLESAVKYGYWCLSFGIPFEYFIPEGLFSGKFLGKRIKGAIVPRLRRKIEVMISGN